MWKSIKRDRNNETGDMRREKRDRHKALTGSSSGMKSAGLKAVEMHINTARVFQAPSPRTLFLDSCLQLMYNRFARKLLNQPNY